MQLDLLEVVVPLERTLETIRQVHTQTSGTLIYQQSYDGDCFLVFACPSSRSLRHKRLPFGHDPTIFLEIHEKREVYLLSSVSLVTDLLKTFPLEPGEEWLEKDSSTAYLCLGSSRLTTQQIIWLATCPLIQRWEYAFPLPEKQVARQREGI